MLVLLAASLCGRGQQPASPDLESLVAAAQRAQAVSDYAAAANDYRKAVEIRPDVAELWANLGLMQHEAGDAEGAMVSFRTALRMKPSLYVPNLFLGMELERAGKAKEAEPLLARAEKLNQNDAQAPLALGRAYAKEGRFAAAAAELERATELEPKLAAAWFELGMARLKQVEADAYTMSERGKGSPFSGALYAESLAKQARFGEAATLLESLLDKHPQPPCLRSALGLALLREHEPAEAEAQFAAERKAHPECSLALVGEERLALDARDADGAAKWMSELWERDRGFVRANAAAMMEGLPKDDEPIVDALLEKLEPEERAGVMAALKGEAGGRESEASAEGQMAAQELYARGEFAGCEARLAAERGAPATEARRLLAACAYFAGDYERASGAAAKMRTAEPGSLEGMYWSIEANERQALMALAEFQQMAPDSARSYILLGDVYHQLERNDDAEAEYRKALSAKADDPAALVGLAAACLSNNQAACAAQAAQAALKLTPEDPELNVVMGEVLMGQLQFDAAEPFLRKGLGSKPQMIPRVHALLGKVYSEMGRTEEAIRELQLGTESDEDGSVEYLLARLYRKTGDTKHAAEALARMKEIKEQRRGRGVKRVEDPDLSSMEAQPSRPATP